MTYSEMTLAELVKLYNELARERGMPRASKAIRDNRVALVEGIVLMRTRPKQPEPTPKPAGKRGPRPKLNERQLAILESLCHVTHYEGKLSGKTIPPEYGHRYNPDKVTSFGLPIHDCYRMVRLRFPHVTLAEVHRIARMAEKREPGFENVRLPQKRPRGVHK